MLQAERDRYARLSPEERTARWKRLRQRRDDRVRAAIPLTTDNWRTIEGFSAYEVSDAGRIRRVKRGAGTTIGRILVQQRNKKGYPILGLVDDDGCTRTRAVHRLVALAFLEPVPTPEHQINHKDTDKTNNSVENLEWATPSENMLHASRNGMLKWHASNRSLSDDDVREIKCLLATTKLSQQAIADKFGVVQTTIGMIKNGRTWIHIKF
jgi:hypothetical protein